MSTPPAPLFFPDLSLSISYEEALRFCQSVLHTLPHGTMKPWVKAQGMNYTMVVNLKNEQIPKPMPLLVQRLLLAWGIPTQLFRRGKDTFVQFERAEDLARVKNNLSANN
ncbi:hypothetical protein [Hymenobacter glacieicola]|uniref:Uncharacterized protein n=1 Tax=Hymenobacter glacieicola TaxID=1562124 RepID=A0ABQ1WNT0_9BACT|nr:hypothetical protein [Hymenobacter glacieicola]GGG34359.1 hypothetical protein GCM10011378_08450 [Hymenobacter glacieicola]